MTGKVKPASAAKKSESSVQISGWVVLRAQVGNAYVIQVRADDGLYTASFIGGPAVAVAHLIEESAYVTFKGVASSPEGHDSKIIDVAVIIASIDGIKRTLTVGYKNEYAN